MIAKLENWERDEDFFFLDGLFFLVVEELEKFCLETPPKAGSGIEICQ